MASRALGKHDGREIGFADFSQLLDRSGRVFPIDRDHAHRSQDRTEDGFPKKLLLGAEPVDAGQVAEESGNVGVTLVIGSEHVGARTEMFEPSDTHPYAAQTEEVSRLPSGEAPCDGLVAHHAVEDDRDRSHCEEHTAEDQTVQEDARA